MKLGLIGQHVEYSRSPEIHRTWLRYYHIDGHYALFDCADMDAVIAVLDASDVDGLNVTIPYKSEIIPYLKSVDPVASELNAVNTLLRVGNSWIGTNTDPDGIDEALQAIKGHIRRVVIIGAGGAARAMLAWSRKRGLEALVWNRSANRLTFIADHHVVKTTSADEVYDFSPDLIVNATPAIAMDHHLPLDWTRLPETIFFDMNYRPSEIRDNAREAGVNVIDGRGMLIGQAAHSFDLWTGIKPDKSIIEVV